MFSHDAVFNVVKVQEVTVGFAMVAFVSIDFFQFLICMKTVNSAVRKIGRIMEGSWSHGGG